jgi:uncharacterized protein YdhG (YjbR/CyaY superfamily)
MDRRSVEVDAYLEKLEPERRRALEALREIILESALEAEESMKYRMPTYGDDLVVCAMAAQKYYMSLYLDTELVEKYRSKLDHLNLGKSCVRFRKLEDLPLDVIQKILKETVQKQSALRRDSAAM